MLHSALNNPQAFLTKFSFLFSQFSLLTITSHSSLFTTTLAPHFSFPTLHPFHTPSSLLTSPSNSSPFSHSFLIPHFSFQLFTLFTLLPLSSLLSPTLHSFHTPSSLLTSHSNSSPFSHSFLTPHFSFQLFTLFTLLPHSSLLIPTLHPFHTPSSLLTSHSNSSPLSYSFLIPHFSFQLFTLITLLPHSSLCTITLIFVLSVFTLHHHSLTSPSLLNIITPPPHFLIHPFTPFYSHTLRPHFFCCEVPTSIFSSLLFSSHNSYSLLIAYYLLLAASAHCSVDTAHCSFLTVQSSLLAAHCSSLFSL
jgi:hypothetical protein